MRIMYKVTYKLGHEEKYAYFKNLAKAQIYRTVLKGKITILRGR